MYPGSDAPTKIPELSVPNINLFPPRPKLPSFNKSSASSYIPPADWQQVALNQSYPTHLNSDSCAPLSPVKLENYCDNTLQHPVKAESPVIAVISPLQYSEVDVKVVGTHTSAKPSLRVKAESPSPARKRLGSTLGDPPPRKRQKVSDDQRLRVKAESPPPFSLYERGILKRKYSNMGRWHLY